VHLEFHSQSDDRPVCFSLAGCWSRLQCRTTEQWSCAKTHGNRAAGREFDGISETANTTPVFVDVRKIECRHYRGQKCCSVGKLLRCPSWNVSWLNSWKSNPMYNTHPKLHSKILGKKCILYGLYGTWRGKFKRCISFLFTNCLQECII